MATVTSTDARLEPGLARGLPYPSISLEAALRRAKAIPEAAGTQLIEAGLVWGYRPKSSGIALTASALKQFGLFFDIGRGDDKVLRPTRLFLDITHEQDLDANIKIAALAPRVLRERFARWGSSRGSDDGCLADLKAAYGYNDAAARTILKVFDDTISFARLTEQDRAKVLADIPEGARHYILNAQTGHFFVNPGPGNITVTALAAGNLAGGATLGGVTASGTIKVTSPIRRFTQQTDQGVATVDLPDPLSKKSIAELEAWFAYLLEQAKKKAF